MRFTKTASGYEFTVDGQRFMAYRNEAGFAHRDWDLYALDPRGHFNIIRDQLASRAECVAVAEAAMKVVAS